MHPGHFFRGTLLEPQDVHLKSCPGCLIERLAAELAKYELIEWRDANSSDMGLRDRHGQPLRGARVFADTQGDKA
jgi:hypothetical protein